LSAPAPLAFASSVFLPIRMPVTRPISAWLAGSAQNPPVTSSPFSLTVTSARRVPDGTRTMASTSPPLSLSARFERLTISSLSRASAGVPASATSAVRAPTQAHTVT
jgi:hypothetical protein